MVSVAARSLTRSLKVGASNTKTSGGPMEESPSPARRRSLFWMGDVAPTGVVPKPKANITLSLLVSGIWTRTGTGAVKEFTSVKSLFGSHRMEKRASACVR